MDGSALTNTLTTSAPCLCRARIVLRNRVVPRLRVGVSVTCETRRSTERTSCRTGPLRPARRAPSLAETHSATAERATTAQSPCSPSWTRTLSERVQTNKSRVGFGERRRADETAPPCTAPRLVPLLVPSRTFTSIHTDTLPCRPREHPTASRSIGSSRSSVRRRTRNQDDGTDLSPIKSGSACSRERMRSAPGTSYAPTYFNQLSSLTTATSSPRLASWRARRSGQPTPHISSLVHWIAIGSLTLVSTCSVPSIFSSVLC